MTKFRAWLLTQECTIEIGKAKAELGYRPLVSHEQGLAAMS
jgi:nucleoside-diphosphate-sugar epimerase